LTHFHQEKKNGTDFQDVAQECIDILNSEWKNHINVNATAAAAWFSFQKDDALLVQPQPEELQKWVAKWGAKYLTAYKKTAHPLTETSKKLEYLAMCFGARTDAFEKFEAEIPM